MGQDQNQNQSQLEVIADAISAEADELLRILVEHGGECTTRDFTTEMGRANDEVAHHMNYHLIRNGLVEKTGTADSETYPIPPNKYRITDRGRDAVDILKTWKGNALEGVDADVDSEEIEDLQAEIRDLQETVDWLTEKVNEHQDTIDFVEQRRGR